MSGSVDKLIEDSEVKLQAEEVIELSADKVVLDLAALASQRSIKTVIYEGTRKRCLVAPAKPDGNCGFHAINITMQLKKTDFKVDRLSFIARVEEAYQSGDSVLDAFVMAMVHSDNVSGLDEWKVNFQSSSYWLAEEHFRVLGRLYGLHFEFFCLSKDNEFIVHPFENFNRSVDESNETVCLAWVATHLIPEKSIQPYNHYDAIVIEPSVEHAIEIEKSLAVESRAAFDLDAIQVKPDKGFDLIQRSAIAKGEGGKAIVVRGAKGYSQETAKGLLELIQTGKSNFVVDSALASGKGGVAVVMPSSGIISEHPPLKSLEPQSGVFFPKEHHGVSTETSLPDCRIINRSSIADNIIQVTIPGTPDESVPPMEGLKGDWPMKLDTYVHREKLGNQFHDAFRHYLVYGLQGLGKTALVAELFRKRYIETVKERKAFGVWIDVGKSEHFFCTILKTLGKSVENEREASVCFSRLIVDQMKLVDEIYLVFDGVLSKHESILSEIYRTINNSYPGDTIATKIFYVYISNHDKHSFPMRVKKVHVQSMNLNEARDVALRVLHLSKQSLGESELQLLNVLADQWLGDTPVEKSFSPLIVARIFSYVCNNRLAPVRVTKLESYLKDIIKKETSRLQQGENEGQNQPLILIGAFKFMSAQASIRHKNALKLLNMCSLLNVEIDQEVFKLLGMILREQSIEGNIWETELQAQIRELGFSVNIYDESGFILRFHWLEQFCIRQNITDAKNKKNVVSSRLNGQLHLLRYIADKFVWLDKTSRVEKVGSALCASQTLKHEMVSKNILLHGPVMLEHWRIIFEKLKELEWSGIEDAWQLRKSFTKLLVLTLEELYRHKDSSIAQLWQVYYPYTIFGRLIPEFSFFGKILHKVQLIHFLNTVKGRFAQAYNKYTDIPFLVSHKFISTMRCNERYQFAQRDNFDGITRVTMCVAAVLRSRGDFDALNRALRAFRFFNKQNKVVRDLNKNASPLSIPAVEFEPKPFSEGSLDEKSQKKIIDNYFYNKHGILALFIDFANFQMFSRELAELLSDIDSNPSSKGASRYPVGYSMAALGFFYQGQFQVAIKFLEHAVAISRKYISGAILPDFLLLRVHALCWQICDISSLNGLEGDENERVSRQCKQHLGYARYHLNRFTEQLRGNHTYHSFEEVEVPSRSHMQACCIYYQALLSSNSRMGEIDIEKLREAIDIENKIFEHTSAESLLFLLFNMYLMFLQTHGDHPITTLCLSNLKRYLHSAYPTNKKIWKKSVDLLFSRPGKKLFRKKFGFAGNTEVLRWARSRNIDIKAYEWTVRTIELLSIARNEIELEVFSSKRGITIKQPRIKLAHVDPERDAKSILWGDIIDEEFYVCFKAMAQEYDHLHRQRETFLPNEEIVVPFYDYLGKRYVENTKPVIFIKSAISKKCGLEALEKAFIIQDYGLRPEVATCKGFISLVGDYMLQLRRLELGVSVETSKKLIHLIANIYEAASLKFDFSSETYEVWKSRFGSPSQSFSDIHFALMSFAYNIRFEFYELDPKSANRLILRGDDVSKKSIIEESQEGTQFTIFLLQDIENHFDLLFIEPEEDLKSNIIGKGFEISGDETVVSVLAPQFATSAFDYKSEGIQVSKELLGDEESKSPLG